MRSLISWKALGSSFCKANTAKSQVSARASAVAGGPACRPLPAWPLQLPPWPTGQHLCAAFLPTRTLVPLQSRRPASESGPGLSGNLRLAGSGGKWSLGKVLLLEQGAGYPGCHHLPSSGSVACPTTPFFCWGVGAGKVAGERSRTWAVAAPSSSSASTSAWPRPWDAGRPAPCMRYPHGAAYWLLPPDTWVSGQHAAQVGSHGPGWLCQEQ